ncbi:MAG: excisionase family protein [Saprospiraceae bacterium]|nr:excisionase family protein [Saprospiraceae bacterium]
MFLKMLSPEQKWISQEYAMAKTGLKRTTLYLMRLRNLIEWSKVGRKVFYNNQSIDELLDRNSNEFNFKTKNDAK